ALCGADPRCRVCAYRSSRPSPRAGAAAHLCRHCGPVPEARVMMFIVRSNGAEPKMPGLEIKLSRRTPDYVPDTAGKTDFFCVGEAESMAALRAAGWTIVELHDGYYEDGRGGGVAIWGQGRYWEVRSEPLTVTEAVGPSSDDAPSAEVEHVNVRRAIFGA